MTVLSRRAKTKADLKRRPGRGPGPAGTICPKRSEYAFADEDGPVTTEQLAFLHRHVGPIGNQQASGRYQCDRHHGMVTFRVRFDYGMLEISRPEWVVLFAAHGSPDGWRYRMTKFHGDSAVLRNEIDAVRTLLERALIDYPFEIKVEAKRTKSATAWCKRRYGEDFLKHKGRLRFRNHEQAFECKLNWC